MSKSPYDGLMDGVIEGALLGSQVRINRLERESNEWEATVRKLDNALVEAKSALIEVGASRQGWRALSREIIAEIKDPSRPRHFSDPKNDKGRNDFLEQHKKFGEAEWTDRLYGKSGRPPAKK